MKRLIDWIGAGLLIVGLFLTGFLARDAYALTALLVDEYTQGSVRYCIYDAAGDEYIITVQYSDLCPMQIEV